LKTKDLESPDGIDSALSRFYDGLKALVVGAAKKKCFSERPPWWNDKIDRFRKIYLNKKKLPYDNRFPENRTYLYDSMMEAKNRFKVVIEQEKSKLWSRFVKDDLAANPWSTVYKLASQKFRQQGAVSSLRKNDTYTGTVLETAEFIVNSLLPDDSVDDQTYKQNAIWQDFEALGNHLERDVGLQPVDEEELSSIIKTLKSNKAPGHDCLKGIFLKKTYNSTKCFILRIINACLKISYFPDLWKRGNLIILWKNPAGDTTSVKNYRPITLLLEYGKVLEKIVRKRLYNHLTPAHSALQYGFVPGSSTVDALGRLVNGIKNFGGTYQLVVFINISGAFDNLWWTSPFLELRKRKLPNTLIKLLKSYVTNRSVKYVNGNVTVDKVITKGCPQGSVLGPSLWNIQLDNLLCKQFSDKVSLTAYADDLAVHVMSDSRQELINIAQQSVDIIVNWARHCKLNISTTKTKIMVINKSKRAHDRDVKVRIDGHAIELVNEFKYLGVILDPGLTFTKHINYTCRRAVDITMALRRKVYLTWGLDVSNSLAPIYKCAIIPIVAYGFEIWAHRMSIKENVRKVLSMVVSTVHLLGPTDRSLVMLPVSLPAFLLLILF